VREIAIIWSLWLCRNDKVFTDKTSSLAGYLLVYQYSSFIVVSTEGGASRPVYRGMFTEGDYSEEYFFPT
jgi:hypothetical protein